jgi:glutamyl-Q tRNA(Asp) synthetase
VVVDDAFQDITHVVRGMDLLTSTPRQIHLQRLLGYPTPIYLHHPVVLDHGGTKLSKQTHAPAVDDGTPGENLGRALDFLGLGGAEAGVSVDSLLEEAREKYVPLPQPLSRLPQSLCYLASLLPSGEKGRG